ncbi:MAG: fructose-6-phosphate aldolase [Candidatus Sericytochromatia bacterium]|nr:fructose-6-phosphate aldolase [Candidatus Sericytochromatia bacterium]
MKFFLDTANVDEIRTAVGWGQVDGVTTNPSLVAREGRDFKQVVLEICGITSGPVSAEVIGLDYEAMMREAREYASWAPNVVVKVPMTEAGMRAVATCSAEGIKTNVTLVFSANQALLAARAGATYVSPFVGRLDDVGQDGMQVIEEILDVYSNYGFETQVLVASVRHPIHVTQAARLGAHVATMPFKVLQQMFKHPLTDAGIERFLADWQAARGRGAEA